MFQDQFDIEDKNKSQTHLKPYVINIWFKLEGKIPNDSKSHSQALKESQRR